MHLQTEIFLMILCFLSFFLSFSYVSQAEKERKNHTYPAVIRLNYAPKMSLPSHVRQFIHMSTVNTYFSGQT